MHLRTLDLCKRALVGHMLRMHIAGISADIGYTSTETEPTLVGSGPAVANIGQALAGLAYPPLWAVPGRRWRTSTRPRPTPAKPGGPNVPNLLRLTELPKLASNATKLRRCRPSLAKVWPRPPSLERAPKIAPHACATIPIAPVLDCRRKMSCVFVPMGYKQILPWIPTTIGASAWPLDRWQSGATITIVAARS